MATGRVPTTANSPLTAKGDLFTFSTAPARLAVGSNGDTIVADSSTATGLKWATAAGGALTWSAYTPTYTNLTIGNATVLAFKATSGNVTFVQGQITFGSTTSVTGFWSVSLPVNANTDMSDGNYSMPAGADIACYDTSANAIFAERANINSATRFAGVQYTGSPLQVSTTLQNSASIPFTWATGDVFYFNFYYKSV